MLKNISYSLIALFMVFFPFKAFAERGIGVIERKEMQSPHGDQWLLVIGINNYEFWPKLSTAVSDAKSLRDTLASNYYISNNNIVELIDKDATRKNIITTLRKLAEVVKQNDSLIIFYAGHGHLDPLTKEGSWVPVESGIDDASSWISNDTIRRYLNVDTVKAKHILLISDSCFAGDFFRTHRGAITPPNERMVQTAYSLDSRQVLTSGGIEPVSDSGFGSNSVFSYFLIKALREATKSYVVPSELFLSVRAGVAENSEQVPQFGALAGAGGQQGGELVLFRKVPGVDGVSFGAPASLSSDQPLSSTNRLSLPSVSFQNDSLENKISDGDTKWNLPQIQPPAQVNNVNTTKLSFRSTAATMKEACSLATESIAKKYFNNIRPTDSDFVNLAYRHNCNIISKLPDGQYRVEASIEFRD